MKARLIDMYGQFKGHIPDEATYEGVKSGRLTFKRPLCDIKEFLVHSPTFLRLMELDKKNTEMKVEPIDHGRVQCPVCKNHQLVRYQNYCGECGQHLDWEVNNELN